MRSISINEARDNLSAWIDRAFMGEEIGIVKDGKVILLKPSAEDISSSPNDPREAFRRIQASSRLTQAEADAYCKELRTDRDSYKDQ
jgi:antitoxin (DNA-binding transcriptional repressor) of toxin-antitoxin stability system